MITSSFKHGFGAHPLAQLALRSTAVALMAVSNVAVEAAPAKVPGIYFGIGNGAEEYWDATVIGAKRWRLP